MTTLEFILLMERERVHLYVFPFNYLLVSESFNKEIVTSLTVLEYLLYHKLGQDIHGSVWGVNPAFPGSSYQLQC